MDEWPESHARVELTADDQGECIRLVVHGVTHHLHSSTAQAMCLQLVQRLVEWETVARGELGTCPPGWTPTMELLRSIGDA